MSFDDLIIAALETLERSPKLQEAIVEYLKARARAETELAAWRKRRK